jgi:hypothetical protein
MVYRMADAAELVTAKAIDSCSWLQNDSTDFLSITREMPTRTSASDDAAAR